MTPFRAEDPSALAVASNDIAVKDKFYGPHLLPPATA